MVEETRMRVIVIGAAGHIGTYLIPMLVDNGYETTAITRTMSQPYEDAPAWHKAERVLLDRENDPDFILKLKEMKPDIIVDLVNFRIADTKKIVEGLETHRCPIICTALPVGHTAWPKPSLLIRIRCKKSR